MGLLDLFRFGKVIVGTVKAVKHQRRLGHELAALPMAEFVSRCLTNLNASQGNWEGKARPPAADAAEIAARERLPEELAEFYAVCDGYASVHGDFPAPLLPIAELKPGYRHSPRPSRLLEDYWRENGNDSDKPDQLAIIPPDDFPALATNDAECHLSLADLDTAIPLCPPTPTEFVVILLDARGDKLPRGSIIDVENGGATRYPGFKEWLGSRASLFGSLAHQMGGA